MPVRKKRVSLRGHPMRCKALPSHFTKKDGSCRIDYRCNHAGTEGCVKGVHN